MISDSLRTNVEVPEFCCTFKMFSDFKLATKSDLQLVHLTLSVKYFSRSGFCAAEGVVCIVVIWSVSIQAQLDCLNSTYTVSFILILFGTVGGLAMLQVCVIESQLVSQRVALLSKIRVVANLVKA